MLSVAKETSKAVLIPQLRYCSLATNNTIGSGESGSLPPGSEPVISPSFDLKYT